MIDAMSTRAKMRLRFPAQVWVVFPLCSSHKSASFLLSKFHSRKCILRRKKESLQQRYYYWPPPLKMDEK